MKSTLWNVDITNRKSDYNHWKWSFCGNGGWKCPWVIITRYKLTWLATSKSQLDLWLERHLQTKEVQQEAMQCTLYTSFCKLVQTNDTHVQETKLCIQTRNQSHAMYTLFLNVCRWVIKQWQNLFLNYKCKQNKNTCTKCILGPKNFCRKVISFSETRTRNKTSHPNKTRSHATYFVLNVCRWVILFTQSTCVNKSDHNYIRIQWNARSD